MVMVIIFYLYLRNLCFTEKWCKCQSWPTIQALGSTCSPFWLSAGAPSLPFQSSILTTRSKKEGNMDDFRWYTVFPLPWKLKNIQRHPDSCTSMSPKKVTLILRSLWTTLWAWWWARWKASRAPLASLKIRCSENLPEPTKFKWPVPT